LGRNGPSLSASHRMSFKSSNSVQGVRSYAPLPQEGMVYCLKKKKPFSTSCTPFTKDFSPHDCTRKISCMFKIAQHWIPNLYLRNPFHNTSMIKTFLFKWSAWSTAMRCLRVHQNLMEYVVRGIVTKFRRYGDNHCVHQPQIVGMLILLTFVVVAHVPLVHAFLPLGS
jgi:hypothetical protein